MSERDEPAGLGPRGRRFWDAVIAGFDLDAAEVEVLVEACRALDEAEALHGVIAAEGSTTLGSRGQVRVHPALGELRAARVVLSRLLSQLQLPDVDGESLPTALQVRGRRAASHRWGRRGSA